MKKDKMFKYELVSFKQLPFYMPRKPDRKVVVEMTEEEAHSLNQALALNRVSKRYVKIEDDK